MDLVFLVVLKGKNKMCVLCVRVVAFTSMVTSEQSVNLITLFLGRLRPPKQLKPVLNAQTFASN